MTQSAISVRWADLALGRPAWRTGRRRWLLGVGIALLIVAAASFIVSQLPVSSALLLALAAFSPYLELGAVVPLAIFAAARSVVGLVLCVACLSTAVIVHAGLFISRTTPDGPRLTVMTANLKTGDASAEQLVRAVRAHTVDVLMVQELTSDEVQRLHSAGLGTVLPYSISDARPQYAGTGLWSRYPLENVSRRHDFLNAFVSATVRPSADRPAIELMAVHLPGPFPVAADWTHDVDHLRKVLSGLPTGIPIVIGGDFNATPDTARFRRLLTSGFADAADQSGAGMTRTFPVTGWSPPLLALDHVLLRGAVASGVKTVTIGGSDHRALLADVSLGG